MTPDEILAYLRQTIAELFEIEAAQIHAESTLFDELDLDSIDAVDLVAKLQQLTGSRIEEQAMRGVKTVGDLAALVAAQLVGGHAEGQAGGEPPSGAPDASAASRD
jgi:acyl carrier protein